MKALPQPRSSRSPDDFTLAVHVSDAYKRSKVLLARAYFDGTLQLLTAAWERVLGYSPHEFEGKTLCQLMGPGKAAAADVVGAILDEQNMHPVDLTVHSSAGEAKSLRFHRRLGGYERTIFIVAEEAPASSARWQTDGVSVWSQPRSNRYGTRDQTEKQLADWEKRMQAIGRSNEPAVTPGPKWPARAAVEGTEAALMYGIEQKQS